MTCALIRRPLAVDVPTSVQDRSGLIERLERDDAVAQFARFVLVGGASSAVYALLFVALADLGDQPANLVGAIASSVLANELHRRLTFRAGGRVSWFTAQWEGGGLALAGMAATTMALAWLDAVSDDASTLLGIALVGAVTGAVGLLRFVALRWVFARS
ncbi:GtrA family protein [Geodermatophilus sp. URMC 64]